MVAGILKRIRLSGTTEIEKSLSIHGLMYVYDDVYDMILEFISEADDWFSGKIFSFGRFRWALTISTELGYIFMYKFCLKCIFTK